MSEKCYLCNTYPGTNTLGAVNGQSKICCTNQKK